MKTRDHGTSECAMTIVNHVPIVKDISRTQVIGSYMPFRQNEWNPSKPSHSFFALQGMKGKGQRKGGQDYECIRHHSKL
jgi:hypothetical protein